MTLSLAGAGPSSVGGGDADAAAFVAAAGISDSIQTAAIETLVTDLKGYGVWTKLRAIYPFVGGTAGTHKWNLKDPRDADAAYRLVFSGGWTHASTGATPNGSTGYADTKFNPSTHGFTSTNGSLAFYSRTNENGTGANHYDIGVADGADTKATILICRYNNDKAYFTFGTSGYTANAASADGRGFFASSKASGNSEGYRNGSRIVNVTDACTYANLTLYIGANNKNGSATYFSAKECAFASIGDTLTQQNHADLYTAVQAYQTTLGRQV